MMTGLASLLALQTAVPCDDTRLELHIGRTWDEVYAAINRETMPDGLSRESLRQIIHARGTGILDDEHLAGCASHVVALVAPLAANVVEIDFAIDIVAKWLSMLAENGLFERICDAKEEMTEARLDQGPPENATDDEIKAWNEKFDYFVETCENAQITFQVGGRDVLVTLEEDATLVIVETEPKTSDFTVLAVFDHSGNWGGDDDDDDGEPEPDPTPGKPELLDA